MIKITGRKLHIPHSEKILGYEGDNLCEKRCFLITDSNLLGLSFKLDVLEYNCCIDLEKEETDGGVMLTWNITSGVTQNGGLLNVQLRGFDDMNELLWHSEIESFFVGDSVNASKHIENVALTEFEEIEKRATLSKNEAEVFSEISKEYAKDAEDCKDACLVYVRECEENVNTFSDILDIHKQDVENPHNVTANQVDAYTKGEVDSKLSLKTDDEHFRTLQDGFAKHESNKINPHNVTAEQVGAYAKTETYNQTEVDEKVDDVRLSLFGHLSTGDNPHRVTAKQVGAYTKEETESLASVATNAVRVDLELHVGDKSNPHGVTAEQVGAYSKEETDDKLTGLCIPASYSSGEMKFTQDNVTVVSGKESADWGRYNFSTSDGEEVVYHIAVSGQVDFIAELNGVHGTIKIDGTDNLSHDIGGYVYSGEVKEYIEISVYQSSIEFRSFVAETYKDGFMTGADKLKLDELAETVGDIDKALDELHAYAQSVISGGETE